MGKKKNHQKSKTGHSKGMLGNQLNRPIRYVGRYFVNDASAATVLTLNLSPLSLDPRCVQISDGYQNFRFDRVRVRAFSNAVPFIGGLTVGYSPTLPSAAVTAAAIDELPVYAIGNGTFGSPWPRLNLSAELHQNQPRWFRRGTGYDDLAELQGQFVIGYSGAYGFNTSNLNVSLLVEYEVHLSGNVDASLTLPVSSVVQDDSKSESSTIVVDPVSDLSKKVAEIEALLSLAKPQRPQ